MQINPIPERFKSW